MSLKIEGTSRVFSVPKAETYKQSGKTGRIQDTLNPSRAIDEQGFADKVKAFFINMWKWIATHLFCCFYKKGEVERTIDKQEADLRFEGLSEAQKKEWQEAIDQYKKMRKGAADGIFHDHLHRELGVYLALEEPAKKGDRKRVLELIDEAPIPEQTKRELDQEARTDRFFDKLVLRTQTTQVLISYQEIIPFAGFLKKGELTPLAAEAVFRLLSPAAKQRLLEFYATANAKPGFTAEELAKLISTNPGCNTLAKMIKKIVFSFQEDTESIGDKADSKR